MFKHVLLKNVHINGLDLLTFVYILLFDIETKLDSDKLAILARLQLQIFFFSKYSISISQSIHYN